MMNSIDVLTYLSYAMKQAGIEEDKQQELSRLLYGIMDQYTVEEVQRLLDNLD